MLKAMKMLAGFRRLRGTALDPFGKTEERRRERQLVHDYLALTEEFSRTLDENRLPAAMELARLPETIRGYGHIKEAAMEQAEARRQTLLEGYGKGTLTAQELRRNVA